MAPLIVWRVVSTKWCRPVPNLQQTRIIHVAKKQLGIDDETYRDILRVQCGVSSSKDLTQAGVKRLMSRFRELGFNDGKEGKRYGKRAGMATPDQIRYVRDLWRHYHGEDNDRALGRWMGRSFGVSDLRFLDSKVVNSVINALREMVNRQQTGKT